MPGKRWVLAGILVLAALHGVFYALTIPPWDLYDEGTHLAYVLTLRDEQRIPHLEEYTRRDIIASEIETERWDRFRIGRPDTSTLDAMGLGGRLYQGYQPPLYYLMALPAALPTAGDVKTTMYLVRLALGPILLVLLAAITWALTREWFPNAGEWTALAASFFVAVAPAAGEAAGRVNNDLLAGVLIAGGLLTAIRLVRQPAMRVAAAMGAVSALAILTKAHGMLLLPVIAVALGLVWRRGFRSTTGAALGLGLPTATAFVWSLWTYARYGTWTGSGAFLEFARPFEPLPAAEFLEALWFNAWSSYWVTYDGGVIRLVTGLVLLAMPAVAAAGLRRVETSPASWAPGGVLALGLIAILWYGNQAGLVYPQGRILLPLFPVAAAVVSAGWSGLGSSRLLVIPAGLALLLSLTFILGWYLPFFYG